MRDAEGPGGFERMPFNIDPQSQLPQLTRDATFFSTYHDSHFERNLHFLTQDYEHLGGAAVMGGGINMDSMEM